MKEMKNNELLNHYSKLLGLNSPWKIDEVKLDITSKKVELYVSIESGTKVECPKCKGLCTIKDHNIERTWRHLDTMNFTTLIHCRVPRSNCKADGVNTIEVPWSVPYSRYTLLFEKFAIEVLLACGNVSDACTLLNMSWDEVIHIEEKAVKRGLERRGDVKANYIGLDEKSFKKGHSYVSVLNDLDNGRVLDVSIGRDSVATDNLFSNLSEDFKKEVKAVSIDMSPSYTAAIEKHFPKSDIVYDKFHVMQFLGKAIDSVWKSENKYLKSNNDFTLNKTKYIWLMNPDNFTETQKDFFKNIRLDFYQVGRAWTIKESFKVFWDYRYTKNALKYFNKWYYWATHSRIKPMIKAAKQIKSHIHYILTYFKHKITNATSEGLNSKIQTIKNNARGFRNPNNYRTAILFFCGKLHLYP